MSSTSNIKTSITEFSVEAGERTVYQSSVTLDDDSKGWAWYRVRDIWFDARPFNRVDEIESFSIHLLVIEESGVYKAIYPVSSDTALSFLIRSSTGLDVHIRATGTSVGRAGIVVAQSYRKGDVARLTEAVVTFARTWINQGTASQMICSPPRGPFDGVGFCTWTSLGEDIHPTEKNLAELVSGLVSAEIPVQTFIIDDGWQNQRTYLKGRLPAGKRQTSGPEEERDCWQLRGLWDFEANPECLRHGLEPTVSSIKQAFAEVPGSGKDISVGVWMSLNGGYWNGIHPESPLVAKYHCKKFDLTDDNRPCTVSDAPATSIMLPTATDGFWNDWFVTLKDQGINFVKVDNQSSLVSLEGVYGITEWINLWDSMVNAAEKVFGPGRVIHCMSHNESTFAGPQGLKPKMRYVWRNSDDFGMEHKRAAAHQEHIQTNLFNALISSHLGVIPDADMFSTAEMVPATHALLRALFPGPLLLTDSPGKHDTRLLRRLIAPDRRGVAQVIRTPGPIVPLSRRLLDTSVLDDTDGTGLWAGLVLGETAIVTVWNTRGTTKSARRVRDVLYREDVEDVLGEAADDWAVVRVNVEEEGLLGAALIKSSNNRLAEVHLEQCAAASFWIAKTHVVCGHRIAVLGFINLLAGPAGLDKIYWSPNSVTIHTTVCGTVGLVSSTNAVSVKIDGEEAEVDISDLKDLEGHLGSLWGLQIRLSQSVKLVERPWVITVRMT